MGAEEMVEILTDKNLAQEEKLVDMEEQLHDLVCSTFLHYTK